MSRDDKVNIAILAVALALFAVLAPMELRRDRDAAFGAAVRAPFIERGVHLP